MRSYRFRKYLLLLRNYVSPHLRFFQLRYGSSQSSRTVSGENNGALSSPARMGEPHRRRSKRLNYADLDRILREEAAPDSISHFPSSLKTTTTTLILENKDKDRGGGKHLESFTRRGRPGLSSGVHSSAIIGASPAGGGSSYTSVVNGRRGRGWGAAGGLNYASSFRSLFRPRGGFEFRGLWTLRLLRMPVLGRLMVRLLTASAYMAYLGGRITFYIRRSDAPPVGKDPANAILYEKKSLCSPVEGKEAFSPPLSRHHIDSASGFLLEEVLDGLYIGSSAIHSRGIFTSIDLPKGTRVISCAQRAFLTAPGFLRFLADTPRRLPETWHYTHPTGFLSELILQPAPYHLLNHSCAANLCGGLSRVFWPAAAASGSPRLLERLRSWRFFDDANGLFAARDIAAGEELTVDYGLRVAPLFRGEGLLLGEATQPCRCGGKECRHFIYTRPRALQAYLHREKRHSRERNGGKRGCFEVARDLLALGIDDEAVLLSLLPSVRPLGAYLAGNPIPELLPSSSSSSFSSFQERTDSEGGEQTGFRMEKRRERKGKLMFCYRHGFKILNEAAPLDPRSAE